MARTITGLVASLEGTASLHNPRDIAAYHHALAGDPCAYCDEPSQVRDHITPSCSGGENHWINYTGACSRCNARKRHSPLLAFLIRRPLLEERAGLKRELDAWNTLTR